MGVGEAHTQLSPLFLEGKGVGGMGDVVKAILYNNSRIDSDNLFVCLMISMTFGSKLIVNVYSL